MATVDDRERSPFPRALNSASRITAYLTSLTVPSEESKQDEKSGALGRDPASFVDSHPNLEIGSAPIYVPAKQDDVLLAYMARQQNATFRKLLFDAYCKDGAGQVLRTAWTDIRQVDGDVQLEIVIELIKRYINIDAYNTILSSLNVQDDSLLVKIQEACAEAYQEILEIIKRDGGLNEHLRHNLEFLRKAEPESPDGEVTEEDELAADRILASEFGFEKAAPDTHELIGQVLIKLASKFNLLPYASGLTHPIPQTEPIDWTVFDEQAQTGDLIAIAPLGNNLTSWVSRSLGSGPFVHVGMIIRGEFDGSDGNKYGNPHGISLWQAPGPLKFYEWINGQVKKTEESGMVTASPITQQTIFRAQQKNRQIFYFPLNMNQVNKPRQEIDQLVKMFAAKHVHCYFDSGPFKAAGADLTNILVGTLMNKTQAPRKFTCASLIASTLMAAGIIDKKRSSKAYTAGSFAPCTWNSPYITTAYPHTHPELYNVEREIVIDEESMHTNCPVGVIVGRPYREVNAAPKAMDDRTWISQRNEEFLSVASFCKFGLQLMSLGAPMSLVEACFKYGSDEIRHAEICSSLSPNEQSVVDELVPHTLELGSAALEGDKMNFVKEVVRDGCINEALSTYLSYCQFMSTCEGAPVKEKLFSIVEDEINHCLLAWKVVEWILSQSKKMNGVDAAWWKDMFVKQLGQIGANQVDPISGRNLRDLSDICWKDIISGQAEALMAGAGLDEKEFVQAFRRSFANL